MAAVVTDQFRIQNANNFIDSVLNANNSYYVFVGLSNPGSTNNPVGFGRTTTWGNDLAPLPDNPIDNLQYLSHYRDTALYGKKITGENVRRVIKKITWTSRTRYDMYRHDYSVKNRSVNSDRARLYDSNYYVINSDYRVYICLYNGSSGDNPQGNTSKDEPIFTDLEPSSAGESGDGYIWKYLFTIAPSDVIKFDSIEYIVLPNNWSTSNDYQIRSVRDAGDSRVNNNQIKIVYIEDGGGGGVYQSGTYPILGDGTGGEVNITVDSSGKITNTRVVNGGKNYTFGIVDLKRSGTISAANRAKLIPIIPPSRGHGYDIYTELGADKVMVYSRFDDSTKDFPTDTKFAQIGIIKNPERYESSDLMTSSNYSALGAIKLQSVVSTPVVGTAITQSRSDGRQASGYVASYDSTTGVLKYYQDRSLYFPANNVDQLDSNDITNQGQVLDFESSSESIAPFGGSVAIAFTGSTTTVNSKLVSLGVTFTSGLANPEINKSTGDIIYIDNRSLVSRDSRQKEDIKIILEF